MNEYSGNRHKMNKRKKIKFIFFFHFGEEREGKKREKNVN